MATLLQIKSSIFADHGNSSQLASHFVTQWQQAHPHSEVIVRDLSSDPIPHLDAEQAGAFFTPEAERNDSQRRLVVKSDTLIEEIRSADALVLGVPMYNFAVPTQLKSWLDQLARAGVTFKYTDQGPVGLLENKPVIVFAARGGLYAHTENDHQAPFLKQFFGFLGLKDVTFIYAEGVNMGEGAKDRALTQARAESQQLLNKLSQAA